MDASPEVPRRVRFLASGKNAEVTPWRKSVTGGQMPHPKFGEYVAAADSTCRATRADRQDQFPQ
jgi:hypothetical protein